MEYSENLTKVGSNWIRLHTSDISPNEKNIKVDPQSNGRGSGASATDRATMVLTCRTERMAALGSTSNQAVREASTVRILEHGPVRA